MEKVRAGGTDSSAGSGSCGGVACVGFSVRQMSVMGLGRRD